MSEKLKSRPVKRVVVMVEYDEGQPSDVYDLTALATELANKDTENQYCLIGLHVSASRDYSKDRLPNGQMPLATEVNYEAMISFKSSPNCGWLEDAVNYSMPDSFTVQNMRKVEKKLRQKLEEMAQQIEGQRLQDAAAVRAQYPIARVRIQAEQIPQTT